jgi:hypothetical protein
MGLCCGVSGYAGRPCTGSNNLRVVAEAQGAWTSVFGSDSLAPMTNNGQDSPCQSSANWAAAASGSYPYDYAIFIA